MTILFFDIILKTTKGNNKNERENKMQIIKLRDKDFKGFICDVCGRDLKHAYAINGNGIYGSECVLKVAGIRAEKQLKRIISLDKIWTKIITNPEVYSLDHYISEYGSIEEVEKKFFKNGFLS